MYNDGNYTIKARTYVQKCTGVDSNGKRKYDKGQEVGNVKTVKGVNNFKELKQKLAKTNEFGFTNYERSLGLKTRTSNGKEEVVSVFKKSPRIKNCVKICENGDKIITYFSAEKKSKK